MNMTTMMSLDSYNNLNKLVAMCFDANAVFDNLAYCLDFHYFTAIADVVHHQIAHIMPVWADQVSDEMLQLSARPTRAAIGSYETDYTDLRVMFDIMMKTFLNMRAFVRNLIETADMNSDDEVRIFGEKFLETNIQIFIKQIDEWIETSKTVSPEHLNLHIKNYTHFINK